MYRKFLISGLMIILISQFWETSEAKANSGKTEKLPLAQKLFPDAELLWSKEFKGRMVGFKIAKESEHIAIATIDDKTLEGKLYYFTPTGKLLWKYSSNRNKSLQKVGKAEFSISDNGKILMANWWWDEALETCIFDESGKVLLDERYNSGFFDFEYFLTPRLASNCNYFLSANRQHIYNLKGSKINLLHLDSKWKYKRFYCFLREDKVVALAEEVIPIEKSKEYARKKLKNLRASLSRENISEEKKAYKERKYAHFEMSLSSGSIPAELNPLPERQLHIVSIPDGKISWTYKFEKGNWFSVDTFDKFLFLYITKGISNTEKDTCFLYCLTKNGKLLWKKNTRIGHFNPRGESMRFACDEEEIIILGELHKLYVLDVSTGITLTYKQLANGMVPFVKYGFLWQRNKVNQQIMISGELRYIPPHKSPPSKWNYTYVLRADKDWNVISETTLEGIVISLSSSNIIGIYESKTERRDSKVGKKCKDFFVNVLKIGLTP